jgi:hypothetical protein
MGTTQGLDYATLSPSKVARVGSGMYISNDQALTWTKINTAVLSTTPTTTFAASGQVALSANGNVILHGPSSGTVTFRSADNGATWTSVTGLAFTNVRPIADPVNSNKFYAYNSNNGAFLISTDGGVSFTTASTIATGGSRVVRRVPGREGHLWVALYGGGLVRSTNSGTSFTKLNNVTYCGAVGLGKAAPGSTYETLYIWGTVNGVLGVHRSTNEGATWVRVNDDAHEYGGPANGQFVIGDMNVYGRVYMSTAGRGIPYGMPAVTLAVKTGLAAGKNALMAYPNPVENMVTLKLPKELVGGTVTLINNVGAVVRTEKSVGADYTLDLSQLPSGLYTISARNGKQSAGARIIKK